MVRFIMCGTTKRVQWNVLSRLNWFASCFLYIRGNIMRTAPPTVEPTHCIQKHFNNLMPK